MLRPDIVFIDAPSQDNAFHPLQQAGVTAVVNAAYAEPTLLGRVEWLKFVGVFFNKETLAAARFDSVVARYNRVRKALTRNLPVDKRPTVFVGIPLARDLVYVGRKNVCRAIARGGGRGLPVGGQ